MSFFWDCYWMVDFEYFGKNVSKYHIWDKYVKFLVDKYQGSPPDKCRSIVKKAGEAISQTHFPQFFLHFYSDQNRRQTLGLSYFGNFKISIMHFVPQIQYILYSPKLRMYSKLRYIFICEKLRNMEYLPRDQSQNFAPKKVHVSYVHLYTKI